MSLFKTDSWMANETYNAKIRRIKPHCCSECGDRLHDRDRIMCDSCFREQLSKKETQ
jgi:hypothetical protein